MSHRMHQMEAEGQLVPSFWEKVVDALGQVAEEVELPDLIEERAATMFGPQARYTATCVEGHILEFSREEMLSLFEVDTVLDIEVGLAADPPIVPYGECYHCSVKEQRRIHLAA